MKRNDITSQEPTWSTAETDDSAYADWLRSELATGTAELDAGKGIPAAKVWEKLRLE